MSVFALLLSTVALTAGDFPRDCPSCGIYAGPNANMVLDPYLRRVDIWPEFYESTCRFEVARGAFVTLSRSACASETTYRANPRYTP